MNNTRIITIRAMPGRVASIYIKECLKMTNSKHSIFLSIGFPLLLPNVLIIRGK